MTIALQRPQVKTLLEAVSGIGAVASYERYSKDAAGMAAFFHRHFVRKGKVNGWVIKGTVLPATEHTCSEEERHTRWMMRGWLSAIDERKSLVTAENLVQAICDKFATDPRLNGTATWCDKPEPVGDIVTGMHPFGAGKYLVHQITVQFTAHERVAITIV